jgi:hypothetical protein
MYPVLRALPFANSKSQVTVAGESVEIVPYQIVIWVGFAQIGEVLPQQDAPRFPAILDTGFSGTFAITPTRLQNWAGAAWNTLPFNHTLRLEYSNVEVPHRGANLWIYPNQYGWRDLIDPLIPPHLLELHGGIAVFGDGVQVGKKETAQLIGPRLPLLGLRALSHARMQLHIDAAAQEVWLDSF